MQWLEADLTQTKVAISSSPSECPGHVVQLDAPVFQTPQGILRFQKIISSGGFVSDIFARQLTPIIKSKAQERIFPSSDHSADI